MSLTSQCHFLKGFYCFSFSFYAIFCPPFVPLRRFLVKTYIDNQWITFYNTFCIDICGYPTIEDNSTYYPPLNADGKPYIECAALLGKELIIKRIQATQTTICPGFERFCKNKQYTNDDPITPECQCEQWKRNGPPCLMSAAFHYYKLDNHTIIQKDINK